MKPKKKDHPPLPDGAVLLGRGGSFKKTGCLFYGWARSDTEPKWGGLSSWHGGSSLVTYAAPENSQIAKLNGLGPKPKSKLKPKSVAWLPTARSPWAVIYKNAALGNEWRFLGFREKRSEARRLAKFAKVGEIQLVRVVRAMIPLR
jgi:hypothetical protein